MKNLEGAAGIEIGEQQLRSLARVLKRERNFDLLSYKPKVLARRIAKRVRVSGSSSMRQYVGLIRRDREELDRLVDALTINVSGFFRNPGTFGLLRDAILPDLIESRRLQGRGLLVVSAGCARGEEAYTLAMILQCDFRKQLAGMTARVVGFDVDEQAVAFAGRGEYPLSKAADVPARYFKGCCKKSAKGFEIKERTRRLTEFMVHDALAGFPFSEADLILCRNLLIYYRREQQAQLVRGFRDALIGGGCLVLGGTEALLGESRSGFKVTDCKEHIYRKAGEEPCGWK